MSVVAIIPARGGSKGISRKNLVSLCGKPLIAWTILQALSAELVDQVIVTTDSDDIDQVAMQCGAKCFWRSAATATDIATSESAIKEVIESSADCQEADAIVFLQATSPIRQQGDIDAAVAMVLSDKADSVFSARVVEGYTWRQSDNLLSPTYSHRNPRQFNQVRTLEENGSIYVFRPQLFLQSGNRLSGRIAAYIMDPLDSFQIDEPEDIHRLEQLMEVRLGCERSTASR